MAQKKSRSARPLIKRKRHPIPASAASKVPKYEEFVEHLDELIVLIDREYRFVMANSAYLRFRRMDKKKIVGRLVSDISGKGVFEKILKPKLDECLSGRVVKFEMKYQYPQMGERDLFISYFPVKGPKRVERVACVFQDITERKLADAAIRMERDRAQQYLDIADVILLALDLDGRISLINRKGCAMLGWEESELLGRDWIETCLPERIKPTLRGAFNNLLGGDLSYIENPVLTKSGEERMIGWHNSLLRDEEGRVIGTLSSGEDITERRRAESRLHHLSGLMLQVQDSERRRLARELHDGIGTYISGLSLALGKIRSLLDETNPVHQKVANECKELIQAAGGEIRTISYLLHPPTLEEFGLESALEWLVRGLSERSGIKISLDVEAKMGRFPAGIELTIFRVTQEALNNVYRHSGSTTASVRLFRESGSIRLEVADKGKGMGPGFLASGPNLTVGISGMQERVRDMSGTFVIESKTGTGCVVRVTLPVPTGSNVTVRAARNPS
jgi:PAS domain S-box-containing protein